MSQSAPNPESQDSQPNAQASGLLERFSPVQMGIIATVTILTLAGAFWYSTRPTELTPQQKLQQALEWLAQDTQTTDRKAQAVATKLRQAEFRDPDFPGAPEYILGLVAFREAQRQHETNRQRLFEQCARLLEASESISLPDEYRPDWCYATGTALHHLRQPTRARKLLEEAFSINPSVKNEVASQLIDMSLDSQSPSELEQALGQSDILIDSLADQADRKADLDSVTLQKTRVLLALGKTKEAEMLLDGQLGADQTPQTQLVRIQIDVANADLQSSMRAKSELQSILGNRAKNSSVNRQALLLLGQCHERLGEPQLAVDVFEKVARKFPGTQECLAAQFHAAGLLQGMKRHEEALLHYQAALASIKFPQQFRNRWLNLDSVRQRTLKAWDDWIDANRFDEALSLSQSLVPLFTTTEAMELKARATQQRAEAFAQEVLNLPVEQRESRQAALDRRWRESGDAFAGLAKQLVTSSLYGGALWKSAEHYRKGRDYAATERMLEKFLTTQPDRLLPLAHVWQGQALLCLDRADEALAHFSRVLKLHSTDPAAFEAAYWTGLCYLEQGKPTQAEAAWRDVLSSDKLTPDAEEWRLSLFQLGRLLYATTAVPSLYIEPNDDTKQSTDVTASIKRLNEAAKLLDEYLKRYPHTQETLEVQTHFANTHLRIASFRNTQLIATTIDAEQRALQTERRKHLAIAKSLLLDLRKRLTALKNESGLNSLHSQLLLDSGFTLGEIELELQEYARAIETLNRAVNEYSSTSRIFPAYLQIATAYDELGQPDQAQSVLQQAKVILERMPEEAFAIDSTNFRSRSEWMEWIDWALQVRLSVSQN